MFHYSNRGHSDISLDLSLDRLTYRDPPTVVVFVYEYVTLASIGIAHVVELSISLGQSGPLFTPRGERSHMLSSYYNGKELCPIL